jgi:hypothetical protein
MTCYLLTTSKPNESLADARLRHRAGHSERRGDLSYRDPGASAYQELHRNGLINSLRRRAEQLGLSLINLQNGEVLDHALVLHIVS